MLHPSIQELVSPCEYVCLFVCLFFCLSVSRPMIKKLPVNFQQIFERDILRPWNNKQLVRALCMTWIMLNLPATSMMLFHSEIVADQSHILTSETVVVRCCRVRLRFNQHFTRRLKVYSITLPWLPVTAIINSRPSMLLVDYCCEITDHVIIS